MQQYGVREIEKLLSLSRSTIRSFITAGFVSPTRGPRRDWRFSFQDLIVLRTAQTLAAANVPRQRINRSVKELRRHLPEAMPLSGLSICAVGAHVVVREGSSRWQVESGQFLLGFDGNPADGSLSVFERKPAAAAAIPDDWFARGVALEHEDPEGAILAYERAVDTDPACTDPRVNLGRLLHETGHLAKAEQVYRDAIKACGSGPLLLYNLGVLLDDLDRKAEAMESYQAALRGDPDLADCHYNLALLYKKLRKPREAIRHMSQYRRLVAGLSE
jgi:tetratricopeptide (TPR) repeat protein